MRTLILDVRAQLLLGWNTYLLFNSDIVNFVWKTDEGKAESIVLLIFFFGGALIIGGWGVVGWGRKSYLGPAEITYFSSRDFSRSNKHHTFWHVISTGCFHVLLLWAIAISDFCFWEIHKNFSFPLPAITFTVNSHANNHFYKYIVFVSNIMQ